MREEDRVAFHERFADALMYAADLHRGQVRKGTDIPYLSHLLSVSALVLEHGGDADEAIAGLLHDAVEDQGGETTRREIERRFGPRVAQIVAACSDTEAIPKPPWRERKEAYIRHLYEAPPSVLLVSCADKLHNARAILNDYRQLGDDLWCRFSAEKNGVLWYYQALAAAFLVLYPGALATELDRVVTEMVTTASD